MLTHRDIGTSVFGGMIGARMLGVSHLHAGNGWQRFPALCRLGLCCRDPGLSMFRLESPKRRQLQSAPAGISRIRAVTVAAAVSGPSATKAPSAQRSRKTRAVALNRLPDWPGATMKRLRSRSARS